MQKGDFTDFLKNEKFIRWVVTPNEELDHFWKAWISSHPERMKDVELARNFIGSLEYRKQHKLDESKYIHGLYHLIELSEKEDWKSGTKTNVFWKVAGVAAMIILAMFIGLNTNNFEGENRVEAKRIIKKTDFGQRQTVQLPDGSVVSLNVGSRLTYEEPFNSTTRQVRLSGEAFFEVKRDVNRPFIIQSGPVQTRVLGTSFNVRAYEDESDVIVAVESGKVQVKSVDDKNEVILIPEEKAVYKKDGIVPIVKSRFNRLEIMGWREGIIQFKDLPLDRVLHELERTYGVEFSMNENIRLKERYSGVYRNVSLEEILKGVCFATGMDYKLTGKHVTLKLENE